MTPRSITILEESVSLKKKEFQGQNLHHGENPEAGSQTLLQSLDLLLTTDHPAIPIAAAQGVARP